MTSSRARGRAAAIAIAIAVLAAGSASAPAAASEGETEAVERQPMIIGGGPAEPAHWRFTVALMVRGQLLCGGTVIAPTKVLTAAHCLWGIRPAALRVVANRYRLRDAAGEAIPVVAKRVHPGFLRRQRPDLAVLTLASPTSAPAVALATAAEDRAATRPGSRLRVAGWGARSRSLRLSGFLKATVERVRRPRRCKRPYGWFFSRRTMICALGKRLRKRIRTPRRRRPALHSSVCSGDSGGPLVADTPGGPRLVGIVSYSGRLCGHRATPSVYARVASALGFIGSS